MQILSSLPIIILTAITSNLVFADIHGNGNGVSRRRDAPEWERDPGFWEDFNRWRRERENRLNHPGGHSDRPDRADRSERDWDNKNSNRRPDWDNNRRDRNSNRNRNDGRGHGRDRDGESDWDNKKRHRDNDEFNRGDDYDRDGNNKRARPTPIPAIPAIPTMPPLPIIIEPIKTPAITTYSSSLIKSSVLYPMPTTIASSSISEYKSSIPIITTVSSYINYSRNYTMSSSSIGYAASTRVVTVPEATETYQVTGRFRAMSNDGETLLAGSISFSLIFLSSILLILFA